MSDNLIKNDVKDDNKASSKGSGLADVDYYINRGSLVTNQEVDHCLKKYGSKTIRGHVLEPVRKDYKSYTDYVHADYNYMKIYWENELRIGYREAGNLNNKLTRAYAKLRLKEQELATLERERFDLPLVVSKLSGLNPKAWVAYFTILRYGNENMKNLEKITQIPHTTFYRILKDLKEAGLLDSKNGTTTREVVPGIKKKKTHTLKL